MRSQFLYNAGASTELISPLLPHFLFPFSVMIPLGTFVPCLISGLVSRMRVNRCYNCIIAALYRVLCSRMFAFLVPYVRFVYFPAISRSHSLTSTVVAACQYRRWPISPALKKVLCETRWSPLSSTR